VVRGQAEDKKLFAAKNDQCIIEKDQLSQANKILFEQCKEDKNSLNDGYSELQNALDREYQAGIEKERKIFDGYLTDQRSKLQKLIKSRGEVLNNEKYEIYLDASNN